MKNIPSNKIPKFMKSKDQDNRDNEKYDCNEDDGIIRKANSRKIEIKRR